MKKTLLFVALLLPALAHAQMRPNHELPQFKNLKAAPVAQPKSVLRMRAMAPVAATAATSPASGSSYAPFLPQGGISHQTDVPEVYADGSTGTLAQIGQMADGSVQQTTINAANGVSGLNAASEAVSPVNTTDVKAARSLAFGRDMDGNPIGYFGPLSDTATSQYFLWIGGLNRFAPGGVKITSQLYGGPENCLLNIQNTYFQQFARCGAGYDQSVAEMVKTTVNSPMGEFGDSVKSPSGGVYTVQYTGTSVKIRPGLSADDAKYFLYRTRIYTNVSNGIRDADTNTPSIWFGYAGTPVAGTDGYGTYTEIPISSDASVWSAGWMRVNSSFAKVTTTTAPGSNSGDATDTVLTNYSAPVILVGTSGTAFNTNRYVNIDLTAKDVQSRTYQDLEVDYYIKDTSDHAHDYMFKVSGATDVVSGSSTYPSPKSFLRKIDGHGVMPNLLQVQNAAIGGRTIHTDSGYQLYKQGDLNSNAVGEKLPYSQLVGANLAGQFANLLLFGSRDAAGDDTTNTGWHRGSIHLGMQYCSGISNQTEGSVPGQSGCAGGGQFVWSPQGYTYGIGLGAGLGATVNYGLYLDSNGYPDFPQGVRFYNGQTVRLYATGNGSDSGKYAQLGVTEGDAGTVTLSYSTGGLANLHIASLKASGASSVQSLTVGNMTGTGTAYVCVNSSGQIYRSTTVCN